MKTGGFSGSRGLVTEIPRQRQFLPERTEDRPYAPVILHAREIIIRQHIVSCTQILFLNILRRSFPLEWPYHITNYLLCQ